MSGGYFGHPRREMRPFVPQRTRRLLDIGCGSGAFAAGLKRERAELEVWGIEYDPEAAARAAEVLDRVLAGDALEIVPGLPAGSFDCICCNDVLEHLVEPEKLLAAVRPLLAPDGVIVASLPNVRYFSNVVDLALRGRWEYTDEGICDRTHLRFFTRGSMLGMFRRAGYRVRGCTGINPTGSRVFRLFNLLTLGRFAEMRYLQFALVCTPAAAPGGTKAKADPSP